jgi:hypothetical protein
LNEIERLKALNLRASKMIYHADVADPIDKKLGDYLNQYPEREKLNILFLRESAGVY